MTCFCYRGAIFEKRAIFVTEERRWHFRLWEGEPRAGEGSQGHCTIRQRKYLEIDILPRFCLCVWQCLIVDHISPNKGDWYYCQLDVIVWPLLGPVEKVAYIPLPALTHHLAPISCLWIQNQNQGSWNFLKWFNQYKKFQVNFVQDDLQADSSCIVHCKCKQSEVTNSTAA